MPLKPKKESYYKTLSELFLGLTFVGLGFYAFFQGMRNPLLPTSFLLLSTIISFLVYKSKEIKSRIIAGLFFSSLIIGFFIFMGYSRYEVYFVKFFVGGKVHYTQDYGENSEGETITMRDYTLNTEADQSTQSILGWVFNIILFGMPSINYLLYKKYKPKDSIHQQKKPGQIADGLH